MESGRPPSRAVLITGCSSGIGRATAERFAQRGWTVYASARNLDSIRDLEASGCRILALDVTSEPSMREAVQAVEGAEDAVGVLVNNAGFGLHGAAEEADLDDVRRQFETNFFGLARLTQLVLPGMRRQGWGKLVNVSSMGGRVTFPGGAFYHASKHAVEAFSDVLRFEVRPFGVDVIVIEPGLVQSRFADTALGTIGEATPESDDAGPYDAFNAGLAATIHGAYTGPMSRFAVSAERVARTIERSASAKRSGTRYVVPGPIRGFLVLRKVLPDRMYDAMLRTSYRPPSPS
ncbi:MAG: SDR family NAD(P)-dependent oxidoreductase [Actinomycetota bacterium]|nr:SDR family NAD(P)-dependent oxidoreductase [Actinomycetota bacterium]